MHKYVQALEGGLAFQSYSPQHGLIVYVYFFVRDGNLELNLSFSVK